MSRIKIRNGALTELGTITDVFSASRTEKLNSDNILNFTLPLTESITGLISAGNIADCDGDYFDIICYQKGQATNGELAAKVECEHVSYRLNDPEYDLETFTQTGTPTAILIEILNGTGFSAGTIVFTQEVTYSAQEKKSRRQLLMEFIAYLGGEVRFYQFTVSIVLHRGSLTPKNLTTGRNIEIISKTYNKREKDTEGNPLITYACSLIKPVDVNLGDAVTLEYSLLDIDVQLRVVSITTNPYNRYEASFEIGNFTPGLSDDAYRIETQTITKDKLYHGVRIGPEYGFEVIRNDRKARAYMNSQSLAFQAGDGSGTNWTNKLYYDFDPETNESVLVFDGILSAGVINAVQANIDVIVNNTFITQNLYAEYGRIANLTVSELNTGWKKITNYLNSDTSDVNYTRDYEQYKQWITASTDGLQTEQVTNYDNEPLYWIDETHKGMTTDVTDYPVTIYVYTELVKAEFSFELTGGFYIPIIKLGAGAGVEGHPDWGKGYIYKETDELIIKYFATDGTEYSINLDNTGIYQVNNTGSTGLRNIAISDSVPSSPQVNDLWIDSDDYSRYDKTDLTGNTTLNASDNEFITCSGTFTITLHSASTPGIIKKIYNIGTGLITLSGTINGETSMYLYPGESVELITDGTDWRC